MRQLLILLLFIPSLVSANERKADILTTLPATFMLAQQLTLDTGLVVKNLAPTRYGIERLPGWFSNQGADEVEACTTEATAVVTLGSVWPADPLFLHAREHNIKIINIDAGQALLPNGQSVATLQLKQGISPYVWLSNANLLLMAEIVTTDLKRLWPQHEKQIHNNYGALRNQMMALATNQQASLINAGVDAVILLDEALEDFAVANDLFVLDRQFKPNLDWNENDQQAIKEVVKEEPDVWFLTTRTANRQLLALLPKGANVLRIEPINRWGRGISPETPLERWQIQLD
ncbi:ABC transporter substrate-binding protein [Photobacterium sanctipauli]|uniref:ABC transporter substrate-binding protein n=1 Tax=Photobacterium sanctipauli TaxID=1342794 RepID=A0A2T3NNR9_9GAMM|nr:zinc ABC transporter solute-binding protein [Photobacterium sanctipauli]PSW17632.1 ABC transporter substrate-binding protein [Photobacterium sanctipauli]